MSALAALAGCPKQESNKPGPRDAAGPREPVAVSLGKVRKIPTERFIEVIGTLQGDEDVTVSAKVAGRVTAVYKDLGDSTEPGELLVEIDPTDYELMARQKELAVQEALAKLGLTDFPPPGFDPARVPTVERAKLQADNAEAKFQRGKQLHEQQPPLISDQDFADLQTAAAVARSNYDVELLAARSLLVDASARRAEVDSARQMLHDTGVLVPQPKKPGAGAASTTQQIIGTGDNYVVAERMVSVGEYVKEGTALFRLVDIDPVKLRATAPEKYVSRVTVGQRCAVSVEAYTHPFEGRVSRMNPQIDPASRTFQVEILIPNRENLLRPGGFAEARISTYMDPNVVFVPQSAVLTFAGVSKVFTVREGKAVEVLIELGAVQKDLVEVTRGLKGTEAIVVQGINRLANGVPVKVSEAKGAAEVTEARAATRPAGTTAVAR